MGGEALKMKACLQCFSSNFDFILSLKSFVTNVLKYKAGLSLKIKCVCVAMYSLVMSPFSRDF